MGDNIVIFKDLSKIPDHTAKEMIVQRYIDNPLTLNNYKFDLRVYVMVTGIGTDNMHAFMADEGLARFCTEAY